MNDQAGSEPGSTPDPFAGPATGEPGDDAVTQCLSAYATGTSPDRAIEKQAVKYLLGRLHSKAPGNSVEVRVPPYAAVQVVAGSRHRRGTPPAAVEADPRTWIELATGTLTWAGALACGRLSASGERSDLSALLPL